MTENDFKASVGKYGPGNNQCYNTIPDQKMIRDLLNLIPVSRGGAGGGLGEPRTWGTVDEDLYYAILTFQKAHPEEKLSVDGHVDPHQKTLRLLLKLANNPTPPPPPAADPGMVPSFPLNFPSSYPVPFQPPPRTKTFKVRYRGGASFTVIPGDVASVGVARHWFDVWDPTSNRSGIYSLLMANWGIGSPASLTGGSDDYADMTTPSSLSLEDLQGTATTGDAGGGDDSIFLLTITTNNKVKCSANVPTGYTEGFDVGGVSGGQFKMISCRDGQPDALPYQQGDML